MADLAQQLSMNSLNHPVQDHTGLTGRYDFVVTWVSDPDSKVPEGVIDSSGQPSPTGTSTLSASTSFPSGIPAETLVITTSSRKPTEN